MTKTKQKAILKRFGKSFVSGFVTSAGLLTIVDIHSWTELKTALAVILISGIAGAVNGVLMAAEKWANWEN
jgi:hypothetical protein